MSINRNKIEGYKTEMYYTTIIVQLILFDGYVGKNSQYFKTALMINGGVIAYFIIKRELCCLKMGVIRKYLKDDLFEKLINN
jgi:hypothetical protein